MGKPSFQKSIRKTSLNNSPAKAKHIFGLEKDQGPTRTVPVGRTTKDDLIRAKSLLNNHILAQHSPGTHIWNHPGILQLTKEDKDYARHEDAVENFLADDSSSDENSGFIVLARGSLHVYGSIGAYTCMLPIVLITY